MSKDVAEEWLPPSAYDSWRQSPTPLLTGCTSEVSNRGVESSALKENIAAEPIGVMSLAAEETDRSVRMQKEMCVSLNAVGSQRRNGHGMLDQRLHVLLHGGHVNVNDTVETVDDGHYHTNVDEKMGTHHDISGKFTYGYHAADKHGLHICLRYLQGRTTVPHKGTSTCDRYVHCDALRSQYVSYEMVDGTTSRHFMSARHHGRNRTHSTGGGAMHAAKRLPAPELPIGRALSLSRLSEYAHRNGTETVVQRIGTKGMLESLLRIEESDKLSGHKEAREPTKP